MSLCMFDGYIKQNTILRLLSLATWCIIGNDDEVENNGNDEEVEN